MAMMGKSGSLYVGDVPTKVAEIANWSLDLGADNTDVTNFDSNGWKEFLVGLKQWSGAAEGNFKLVDLEGQMALYSAWQNGTAIKAEFRLGSASPKFVGTILVNSVGLKDSVEDKVTISFGFQGTGALAYTA